MTKFMTIENLDRDILELQEAAEILKRGGLVAFPTETVYGLGANALDENAVQGIFRAKGRPSDNPLIVHVANLDQVFEICGDITVQARRVMEAFWPGPLTVVLTKKALVPNAVTAGLNTVAIRMPDHPVARALIEQAGVPIAAPSANTSGKPSPTTAEHVRTDLDGKIDAIIDGGPCRVGLESTVLDLSSESPTILRPGAVTRDDLEGVLGHVEVAGIKQIHDDQAPKSPGMKYRHYSPKAPVILVVGDDGEIVQNKIRTLTEDFKRKGKTVGVMATVAKQPYDADYFFEVGTRDNLFSVASNLFYGLRFLDEKNVNIIIAEGYREDGVGLAIMNRLGKAAQEIIYV